MTEFFETAQAIGARLCRDAIWSNGRCNWIGASMESVAGWTVVQKSFGPDLYSGTSGIGILLAELAALNNERFFRRVAEGAASQALSRAADIPLQMRAGFYSGHAGIAYAITRIGERLDNEALIDRGQALMDSLTGVDLNEQGIDVVSEWPERFLRCCSCTRKPDGRACSTSRCVVDRNWKKRRVGAMMAGRGKPLRLPEKSSAISQVSPMAPPALAGRSSS